MPIMVDENISAAPIRAASAPSKPANSAVLYPTAIKAVADTSATTVDWRRLFHSAEGFMSRPSKNSRKMIPTCPASDTRSVSDTTANPKGPSATPRAIYAMMIGWRA